MLILKVADKLDLSSLSRMTLVFCLDSFKDDTVYCDERHRFEVRA